MRCMTLWWNLQSSGELHVCQILLLHLVLPDWQPSCWNFKSLQPFCPLSRLGSNSDSGRDIGAAGKVFPTPNVFLYTFPLCWSTFHHPSSACPACTCACLQSALHFRYADVLRLHYKALQLEVASVQLLIPDDTKICTD